MASTIKPRICYLLERFRPNWLVDTGQIASGTALQLFAVAPLRLITTPCSVATLPRSRLSQSGRKRSSALNSMHRKDPEMYMYLLRAGSNSWLPQQMKGSPAEINVLWKTVPEAVFFFQCREWDARSNMVPTSRNPSVSRGWIKTPQFTQERATTPSPQFVATFFTYNVIHF